MISLGVLGVVGGLGYAAYTDYQDNYDVNGSIGWQRYLGYSIIGGATGVGIGFTIGYFGPATLAYFGGIATSNALAVAAGGGTVVVANAGILEAMLATGALVLFSKGFGPRMGHNQYEKQQWDEAMRRLGIKDKDLIRRLHNKKINILIKIH